MNILHVLSQKEVTGAETYAVGLANNQICKGNNVWLISDTLHTSTQATYVPYSIANRRYKQRLKNICYLRKFIRENDIEIVHAHSRAASWISYFALLGTRIPLISSVHGRQHLHTSTRLFDMYGDKVIAVCDDLKTHLVAEVKIPATKISVIPNGFDFTAIHITSPLTAPSQGGESKKRLSLVGRTSGPKGERTGQIIGQALPSLLQAFPDLYVDVIGGPVEKLGTVVLDTIQLLNKKFGERIRCLGFVNNLSELLASSDLVIASGRVAIDALWLEKPLLAFGESQYHGLVNATNLEAVMASNFGDILPTLPVPAVDYQQIGEDIRRFFSNPFQVITPPPAFSAKAMIERYYNINKVAEAIFETYLSARFKKLHPRQIPVLMYHKIPERPIESKHRIFVTRENFEKHLLFLQKNGFTPITFREYDAWKRGLPSRPPYDRENLPKEFPKKPIFLTFDDAYLDNYTLAFPLLKRFGFKATIFSLGDETHRDNFWDVREGEASEPLMNTAQKLEMQEYGIEFGSHTLNHVRLPELREAEGRYELCQSKKNLETQLGTEVIAFAYPYGQINPAIKQWTVEAGYRYAVAIDSGGLHLEDDPLEIFRAYIFPEDAGPQLRKKTSSWYRRYYRWKRGK